MKTDVKRIISRRYNQKVKRIFKYGPVWKVQTKEGYLCFKRWKHKEGQLLFVYHAVEELWRRGYYGMPRLIPDAQDKHCVKENGEVYVLTKWVGRPLNDDLKKEWILAARELALFHAMSKNIELPPGVTGPYFSGKWLDRFPKRVWEMRDAFNRFRTPKNIFEEEVTRNALVILEIAEMSNDILKGSGYEKLSENLHCAHTLCHGNIKAKNFTVTEEGNVSIIDFDSLRFDVPVQDLAAFFMSALSAKGWSVSFANTLLNNYNDVRQIEPEEMPILKALLIFPYELCKLIQKYQRGDKTPEAFLRKWDKELNSFLRQQHFFERWLC